MRRGAQLRPARSRPIIYAILLMVALNGRWEDRRMRRSSADLPGAEMPPMLSRLMDIVRISALAELASGVAHEINQPLAAIAAFSQAGIRLLDRDPPAVLPAIEVLRQIS